MKRAILLMSLLLSVSLSLFSQKAPIKFGDVDIEDLKMTVYPGDTSAVAVILCDYGFFRAGNIQFTRNLRVKILKKEGYYWANSSFPYSPSTKLRGITFNLEDGKVVESKLKNESIFSERVTGQNYRTRIAMPNVKVGSVIDLEFSFFGIPNEWSFQDKVPVRYSELNLEPSPRVRFRTTFYGFEKLSLSTPDRWIAHDIKAFKAEPFMNSENNYMTKIQFDILDIVGYHQFASTWDNIFQDMLRMDDFGKALDLSGYLNDLAKSIKATGATGIELMKIAYDSIRTLMKWNEQESCYTSSPTLGTVYKKKTGNSADINFMLLQLLKKLDFRVTPVILSTRSNGMISPITPSYSRLNYVIVQVNIAGNGYLLDATETYLPYYLLPYRALNFNGRTVVENGSQHVDLSSTKTYKISSLYTLELNDDMELQGDITVIRNDYSALEFRKKYHSFNSTDEYLDDLKKGKTGLVITGSQFENIDSVYKPAIEKYQVKIADGINRVGDELYFIPMFYDQVTENPFKTEDRRFPIDYGYRTERTVISTVKIPDGYNVSTLPQKVVFKMPDNSATFLYDAVNNGTEVKITGKLVIARAIIPVDQYQNFRAFYDRVVAKQAEPVIFKKQ